MFIALAILLIGAFVALHILGKKGDIDVPQPIRFGVLGLAAFSFAVGIFNKVFFYADPGFQYHVRTILGNERVVDGVTETGYNLYLFGYYTPWKKALTVQATDAADAATLSGGMDSDDTSANLPAQNLTFLDQVDANVEATVRFRLPDDDASFIKLAREYRSPDNLLRTSLVPAFRETLQANASLMNAEEYYTGGRTAFNREFEDQMQSGIYVVQRTIEERTTLPGERQAATANASLGQNQQPLSASDEPQVITTVERVQDATGQQLRKAQAFAAWGISVIETRITDVEPNVAFQERMTLRQKASADRSIARERRIQEEEERLLAIAKGDREVAQRQAAARVEQIAQTTNAETAKQLALTQAAQRNEQATIDKSTAQTNLETARINAQSVQVAADAEAYQRREILEADNALQAKLDAWITINKNWSDAFARAPVPSMVMGGSSNSGPGRQSEAQGLLDLLTIQTARQLSVDPNITRAAR